MTAPAELLDDHWDVLHAVAYYHLLTIEQMQRVGVAGGSRRRIDDAVRLLKRKYLIDGNEARQVAYFDHVAAQHWLTRRGAEVVGAVGSRRTSKSLREAKHRIAIVDVHIDLRAWVMAAGGSLEQFVPDFTPGRRWGHKPTKIEGSGHSFSPDALAKVTLADGKGRILVLEVERGGDRQDRAAFRRGIEHWRGVAGSEVVEDRLNASGAARFLLVFQSAEMRRKAMAQWPDPADAIWHRFFCKGLDELAGDFNVGWWQPGGGRHTLFPAGLAVSG